MKIPEGKSIAALRTAILKFGQTHPYSLRNFEQGQRVIKEGAISDECFLIKEGAVRILVATASGTEAEIAVRFEGDLIGETSFLQRNMPRTASVEIASKRATLVGLTKADIFKILQADPTLGDAITPLWELATFRQAEIQQVLEGELTVENRLMSVLLADIHNFSILSERVWDEQTNSFLYEFMEEAHDISFSLDALFEDQGDGFKILFQGKDHAERALLCANSIMNLFRQLRATWIQRNDAFSNTGLGIGICSDFMSIRKRHGSRCIAGRVYSHSINVAAAMSKYRVLPTDVDIYVDENTLSFIQIKNYDIVGPEQRRLEKIGRDYPVYKVQGVKKNPLAPGDEIKGNSVSEESTKIQQLPISILFLASDPTDLARLRLQEEAQEIWGKLQRSKHRDRFTFHNHGSVQPENLSQLLLDIEPTVIHFSGHEAVAGELRFENKAGTVHPISPASLAALFREFSPTVKCVILNGCYSAGQADAIASYIDCVVGMNTPVAAVTALPSPEENLSSGSIAVDEDKLIGFVGGLTPGDFERIVVRFSEAPNQIPNGVSQYQRVTALISYMRSTNGPGLGRLATVVEEMFPDRGSFRFVRQNVQNANNFNTNKPIRDRAAIAFAVGLYQAIGAGKTFEEAYRLGCVQISLQGFPEDENLTPILKIRSK